MPEKEKREPLLSHGGVRSSGEASTRTGVSHALITTSCLCQTSKWDFLPFRSQENKCNNVVACSHLPAVVISAMKSVICWWTVLCCVCAVNTDKISISLTPVEYPGDWHNRLQHFIHLFRNPCLCLRTDRLKGMACDCFKHGPGKLWQISQRL